MQGLRLLGTTFNLIFGEIIAKCPVEALNFYGRFKCCRLTEVKHFIWLFSSLYFIIRHFDSPPVQSVDYVLRNSSTHRLLGKRFSGKVEPDGNLTSFAALSTYLHHAGRQAHALTPL